MEVYRMKSTRLHTIARVALAIFAAVTGGGMYASGYTAGTDTSVGMDAGTLRDTVMGLLAAASVFYPQILTVWNSLTNNPRLDSLEKRVDKLDGGQTPATSAVVVTAKAKAETLPE